MSTGTVSVLGFVVGAIAVVGGIGRLICYYIQGFSERDTLGRRLGSVAHTGPGPARGALLMLAGIGLAFLHLSWLWPDGVDQHQVSLVLSVVMCGAGLLFMVYYRGPGFGRLPALELEPDGFYLGLGAFLMGVGNALIQLSFVWHRSDLSYWGLGVVILGFLITLLGILADALDIARSARKLRW